MPQQNVDSRISVEGAFWFVFEVDGTKVTKLSFYSRRSEAIKAVGLRD